MYLTVNECRLYVDIEGSALVPDGATMRERPILVLVHGGPGADHTINKPTFSALTDTAQVIHYDHRGNGRSDSSTPAHWTLAQWADDLRALIDGLGIARPIVCGISFGGFVAQAYATRYPGHAHALILISTAAKMEFEEVFAAFARLGGSQAGALARAYWTNPTPEGRTAFRDICLPLYSCRPMDPDTFARMIMRNDTALHFNGPTQEHGRMDFRATLANVTCPVLLMAGEDDPITPISHAETIARSLTNANVTFQRFANCGHGVLGDQPEAMALIRQFLRDHS